MRNFLAGSLIVTLSLCAPGRGAAAVERASSWVQWHCLGAQHVARSSEATELRSVWAEPASQAVLERALSGLAQAAACDPDGASLTRSLLDELLQVESHGAFGGTAGSAPSEWAVALRVGADRIQHWMDVWPSVGAAVRLPQTKTARAGEWFLGALGRDQVPDLKAIEDRLAAALSRPPSADLPWLDVQVDLARLAKALGWPASLPWPQVQASVLGRGPHLRTTARIEFEAPLDLTIAPWQLPTNTVREPLLSFAAVRGIQRRLEAHPIWQELDWPAPNQFFLWARSVAPYATEVAWPMPAAAERIQAAAPRLPAAVRARVPWLDFGEIKFLVPLQRLTWSGFPILVPYLNPALDDGLVTAGLFPVAGDRAPAPAELYAQFQGRTNLLFYHWELTQPRLGDWQALHSMHAILARLQPPSTNSVVLRWLENPNVTAHLGNCITEVSQTGPREWRAVRTSSVGLTAFELHRLVHWIDGDQFPRSTRPKPALGGRTKAPTAEPAAQP
jgi:hypothetical protein